jgi:hypothetical protein
MAWSAEFTQPIRWGASTLRTLHDARDYILKLPRTKQILPTWQAAVRALLQAAEHGGMWLELARIAMLQALLGPNGYKIIPLSGAQLVNTDEKLAVLGIPANIPERRRIEIRLRKSVPPDATASITPPVLPTPKPRPPVKQPAPVSLTPAVGPAPRPFFTPAR